MIARQRFAAVLLLGAITCGAGPAAAEPVYAWSPPGRVLEPLSARFSVPTGFTRVAVEPGSFAEWLRALPLRPPGAPVLLHSGQPKARQDVHAAVIDIDTGPRDLQQCADAIMRLRAEYQFSQGRLSEIGFNATSGERMPFSRWASGERPQLAGNRIQWTSRAAADSSYPNFRRYLDFVFSYAGTTSLEREMKRVPVAQLLAGDVFIKGGFPGHAVLVLDVAINAAGEKRFLLAQSFMPAQDMHVLKNPAASDGSAWYSLVASAEFVTPEWTFARESLKRF